MQPDLPGLPPMQTSMARADIPTISHPPGAANNGAPVGTRRLRQVVSWIGGASLGFLILVGAGQLVLKPGLRPTDIAATMEAQTEIGIFNQKLGAKPGETLLTEDQYKAKMAEAERSGAAKAELVFQRQISALQADRERVVSAYATLYQRTNLIAQAGVQMEAQAQQFRQQLLASTNGGRAGVLIVQDSLCAIGGEEACEAARKLRRIMVDESTELSQGDLAKKVRELMSGIDDPATLAVRTDELRNGVPAIRR